MLKLYLDEDVVRHSLVDALQTRGIDVVTSLESGMNGRSDREQLRFATEIGRPIVSFNVGDFMQLHTEILTDGSVHSGIVLARQQLYSVKEIARRLTLVATFNSAETIQNQVVFLSAWSSR